MSVHAGPETHLTRFRRDVARWIRPQEVAGLDEVTVWRTAALLWRHPPLRAVAWFRFGSWAKQRRVPLVAGYIQRRLLRLYGLEMSPGADIGGGLYIAHPVGCVLAVERMGRNVTVIASATFGMRNEPRWPRIGDGVLVGAGARVLGGIELADGCAVGANSVVLTDVPPGATVVGIPGRVVARRGGEPDFATGNRKDCHDVSCCVSVVPPSPDRARMEPNA